jgi:hypothetical protein
MDVFVYENQVLINLVYQKCVIIILRVNKLGVITNKTVSKLKTFSDIFKNIFKSYSHNNLI